MNLKLTPLPSEVPRVKVKLDMNLHALHAVSWITTAHALPHQEVHQRVLLNEASFVEDQTLGNVSPMATETFCALQCAAEIPGCSAHR